MSAPISHSDTKLSARELLERAATILAENKAEDIVALDIHEISSVADYFLIATGGSEPHVQALAGNLARTLSKEGAKPWHREGEVARRWILLDYVDVVVHIFHHETRDYYRLEHLWADATRVDLSLDAAEPDGS